MNLSIALTVVVAAAFTLLGAAKLLALAPTRELAAEAGFSVTAYRGIGALEVAGVIGVALGQLVPLFGGLAGAGLLLLLAGAVATHLRNGDGVRKLAPALLSAALVASYLAALFGVIA